MTTRNRVQALLLTAIAALAFTGPAAAQGKTDVPIVKAKVKMSHVPSTAYGAVYVALERGYFAQRGLDVELVIVRGGDTTYQVAGGTLEFAGGSPDSAFFNGPWGVYPFFRSGTIVVSDIDRGLFILKEQNPQ